MAHRDTTLERRKRALVEHLRDQPQILGNGHGFAIAHRDTRALLATVLQRLQASVWEYTPNTAHSSSGRSGASPGKMDVATGVYPLSLSDIK